MFVSGIVPFKNKKEKLQAWKELMREFNGKVKIITHPDKYLTYTANTDRHHI